MFAKKLFLLTTAILAVGVTSTACSGGDDDDDDFTLSSGEYGLTVTDVPTNTCWPAENPLPVSLVGFEVGIQIISTSGTTFQIVTEPPISSFLPPVNGTITGNDLAATGNVTGYAINTSGCTLDIAASADGELTGDDEFFATITANLTIPQSAAAGCAPLVGESIPGTSDLIPWPTLTNGSSGTCSIAIAGDGVLAN